MIRLHANENFYGCSPKVVPAMRPLLKEAPWYPTPPLRLEEKLAEKFGVNPANIITGAGSVRLIDGLIQSFVESDEEILFFERSFVAYEQLATAHRRRCVMAPQKNFVCDPEILHSFINSKTKLIFIANPNNPTGTMITHRQLSDFMERVPHSVLVVVDEAYAEYVTDNDYPDTLALRKKYPNLIILRSFSKIYGLAGLRIGFAIADESLAGGLKKNRIPYFLNYLSEAAALAALDDVQFINRCSTRNRRERDFMFRHLKKAGYTVAPSQTNFLFVYLEDEKRKEQLHKRAMDAGLMICNLSVFGQDHSLRVGIGNRTVSEALLEVFKDGH